MVDITASFNPIDAVRRLRAAGCDPELAEAIVGEIVAGQGGLATKAAIAILGSKVDVAVIKALLGGVVIASALFAALQAAG